VKLKRPEDFAFSCFLNARLPCLRPAVEEGYLEQDVPPECVGSSIVPANASPDRAADD